MSAHIPENPSIQIMPALGPKVCKDPQGMVVVT